MILLRMVFLSVSVSLSLYSSQPKVSFPNPTSQQLVAVLNFSDTLPTFLPWYRNFSQTDDYRFLRESQEVEAIYFAGILAQNDLRAKIALERLEIAKQQLQATQEQNKLYTMLMQSHIKQLSAANTTPALYATAAAPAPSAPSANIVFANQMPPDQKSAAN